jgi:PAS domain S-box-containing protein
MVAEFEQSEVKIKRLEKALREQEARFSTMTSISSDAIIIADRHQRILFFNNGAEQIFGYAASEVVGEPIALLIPQRFLEKHREHVQSFYAGTETSKIKGSRGTDIVGLRKDGSEFPAEASISKGYDNEEVVFTVILRDISDRKRAEQALREEHEELTVTLRSIGDGVITSDSKGKVKSMNRVAEKLTGWSEAEAAGKPLEEIFKIFNEKTRKPVENPVQKVLETGVTVRLANYTVLKSKDGTERNIADSGAPIRNQEGKTFGVVLVFRDVTGEQKMQEEMLKTMKLESIGLLAGGIAHDFNNILTAILGNVSLAKLETNPQSAYQRLSETERAVRHARDLAFQLLTFSKGGSPLKRVMSIVELLKESTLFALRGSHVRPEFYFAHDLCSVEIDEGQMTQVVHNLVINAQQAMPHGGVILIHAENKTLEEQEAKQLNITPGPYIVLSFKDTGKGIPKEALSKIFDPFFTTKEKGSGLGLFSTYSIVKNHDGKVTVSSELGVGTTFFIYLPAVVEAIPWNLEKGKEIVPGTGSILVLDDDEMVRNATGGLLQSLGYEVECAATGEEAVDKYKQAKGADRGFDAVIVDLTLPGGMSGKETMGKLIEYDREVKAIIASGYSNDPAIVNYHDFGFKDYLAKPYQMGMLSRVLHRVLKG